MADSFQPDSFAAESDSFEPDTHPTQPEAERPGLLSRPVEQPEIESIASRHAVDPEKLRSIAPYYGVNLVPSGAGEALTQGVKGTVGEVGSTLGLNIPQKAYSKLALSESERRALDELRDLSEARQSTLENATQFGRQIAAPIGGIVKGAGTVSKIGRVAEATGIGAAASAAGAHEGKEAEAAKSGAVVGGALGVAGEALGKLLGSHRIPPAEAEAIRGRQADVGAGMEKIAAETAESEKVLEDIALARRDTITPEQSRQIAEEQFGRDTLNEYLDPSTEKGQVIRHQIDGPATDENIVHTLSDRVVDGRVREFAHELTGKPAKSAEDALETIQAHAARQGEEATANSYRNFVNLHQAERAIEDLGAVAKSQPGFWGSVVNKLSDNQYVLRHLDDKYGIDSEAILRELNKARNRLTFARAETRKDLGAIHDQAVRNGTDKVVMESDRLYHALDSGDMSGLSQTERQTAAAFREYFQKGLNYANGVVKSRDPGIAPLNIPRVENYVPHVALPIPQQIPIVERKLAEAEQALGRRVQDLSEKELAQLAETPGPVADLVAYNKWADSKATTTDGRSLVQDIEQKLHSREGNIVLESRARAAMAREGEIPAFIRQRNLYKLADSWAHNTYNHLFLRNSLEKLSNEARKLDKLGAQVESDYVGRIVQDSLGIRKGTAAEGFLQSRIGAAQKFDKLIDKYGRTSPMGVALTAARNVPEILYGLTRNIYPNLLGFGNMYAATQNLVTGFTRLAPELGTRYGYTTVLRGATKALLNFREYYKLAEKMGNVPANVIRHGEAAIADGLLRSRAFNLPRAGYQKLAEFGMKLFETSEKFNRALTVGVADMMAADVARGSASALGSLRRFPASIQKQIMRNPRDTEATSRLLAQYLNDTTQFNYNRSALFEYGRTLGPVLSTFSKWPTAILGEAAHTYRRNGLVGGTLRNMERLALPFILLQAVDYTLGERTDDPDSLSDRTKKFLGSHGFSAMAPGGALKGFVTGEIFTPPAVDFLMKGLVIPAFSGDTEKLGKGLDTALRNYAPGSGLVRFITDDMVTYLTGHRPVGSTFIERTEEGARKLGK